MSEIIEPTAAEMASAMFAEPDAHALICWIAARLSHHRGTAEAEVLAVIEAYQRGLIAEDAATGSATTYHPPISAGTLARWTLQYGYYAQHDPRCDRDTCHPDCPIDRQARIDDHR